LKQYRPHRRPITDVPAKLESNPVLKKKRRLIVRDWFFFVVWYLRLKRILSQMSDDPNLQNFFFFDPKYKEILFKLIHENMTVE
jgi:hypothetical protein